MTGRTLSWVVAVAVACALLVTTAAAVPAGQVLVVEDAETGATLLRTPVHENSTVSLEYMHSVERSPVHDVYAVRDGRLVMVRTVFESYGWGFPADADVREVNGTFVYEPENRSAAVLYVKPGRIAGHRLRVDDRTYDLVALSDARSVALRVEHRSMLQTALSYSP